VVTVGSAIYIGSQIGYSPKFWLSTQRRSVGIPGYNAQVFPGRVAISGVLNIRVTSMFLLIGAFVSWSGAVSEL